MRLTKNIFLFYKWSLAGMCQAGARGAYAPPDFGRSEGAAFLNAPPRFLDFDTRLNIHYPQICLGGVYVWFQNFYATNLDSMVPFVFGVEKDEFKSLFAYFYLS